MRITWTSSGITENAKWKVHEDYARIIISRKVGIMEMILVSLLEYITKTMQAYIQ